MRAGSSPAMLALCSAMIALPAIGGAQPMSDTGAVSVSGAGNTTWVLLSGTVGGIAGFRRLEARMLARGDRVVIIDAYRLSADSAEASFAALARRVDGVLEQVQVERAHVIAHSHGAGVALRLAANAPHRVATLTFLDAGALTANESAVLRAALRLVPLIARIPGGRSFLRDRFVRGLHENAGRRDWIDDATIHAYTEPLLRDVDRVIAMAFRIARAREPESLENVVARVRAPLLVILGTVPRPAGPTVDEFAALAPLGARLRIERLPGVGHFVHEEAPDEVLQLVATPQVAATLRTHGHR